MRDWEKIRTKYFAYSKHVFAIFRNSPIKFSVLFSGPPGNKTLRNTFLCEDFKQGQFFEHDFVNKLRMSSGMKEKKEVHKKTEITETRKMLHL